MKRLHGGNTAMVVATSITKLERGFDLAWEGRGGVVQTMGIMLGLPIPAYTHIVPSLNCI